MNFVAVDRWFEGLFLICNEFGIVQQKHVRKGGAEKSTVNIYFSQHHCRMTLKFRRRKVYLFAAGTKQLYFTDPGQIGETDGKQVLMIAIDPGAGSVGTSRVLLILNVTLIQSQNHSFNSRSSENVPSMDHSVHVVRSVFQFCFINFSYS